MQLSQEPGGRRKTVSVAAFAAMTTGVCALAGWEYLSIARGTSARDVSAPKLEAISSGISAPRTAAQDDSLRKLRQANPSAERVVVVAPNSAPTLSLAPSTSHPKRKTKAKAKHRRARTKPGSGRKKTPSDLTRNLLTGPANHFRLKTTFAS